MEIKELVGHSGCRLSLCKEDDIVFVRKSAGRAEYNKRLEHQYVKQARFKSPKLKTPEVLKQGKEGGVFFFDMDYIHGRTLADYAASIPILEIAELIKVLFETLHQDKTEINPAANDIFGEKLEELSATALHTKEASAAHDVLKKFDWRYVYESPCHGDLTLENIIVNAKGDLFLIDFLDSFYNSWLIDIAKLLQDLDLGWSFRSESQDTTRDFRLLVAKEALLDGLNSRADSSKIVPSCYHLLLLNLLRIYPYAKDSLTIAFLDQAAQKTRTLIERI